jgi:transposase-like protein
MPKMIDPELKARAVRLVSEHRGEYTNLTAAAQAVAKQVGVGKESVRRWVIQAEIDAGHRDGRVMMPTPPTATRTPVIADRDLAEQDRVVGEDLLAAHRQTQRVQSGEPVQIRRSHQGRGRSSRGSVSHEPCCCRKRREQPHPDSARLAHLTPPRSPSHSQLRRDSLTGCQVAGAAMWGYSEVPGPLARAVAEGVYLVSLERCVAALRARARARTSSGTAWSWRAWSLATIRVTACPAASRYW